MGDFLFYQDRRKEDHSGKLKLPDTLKLIHTYNLNSQLLSSGNQSQIFQIKNENIEFILIGNFTFHKNFTFNIDLLIQNNKINHDELNRIFRKINGIYCCIIFNNLLNLFNLCTDYLGFYPLYLYQDKNLTLFSSEIKYIKSLEQTQCTLNDEAIYSYLNNGHLMFDQSWFKEIKRTRPASVYTLNLNDGSLQTEYYWTWANVKKIELPERELIQIYTELFEKGIENLDIPQNSITGLSLSGGLDSRWIAQIASGNFNIEGFTFSTERNYELLLAERVESALNIKHQNPIIETKNWLLNRLQSFWKTDGMLHLGHLHEGNLSAKIHSSFTHCFHGFYGGGIYADSNECNHRISDEIAKQHFKFRNSQTNAEDLFYNTTSIDPYIADQKIRYQSAYSIYLLSTYCKMIVPFYNMDWLELNYSIDDNLQLNSKFYLKALNSNLNDKLLNIPWQRTGLPPKYTNLNVLSTKFKIPQILESINLCLNSSRHFINYHHFDNEINQWILEFKSDIFNLQIDYALNSRERKLRMLSLVIWLKMLSKNSPDVI